MKYVCITCGNKADKLYHEYKGGIIKITICEQCGNAVDKYVEYDLVIVSLDGLLLKRQAFRHILINTGIQSHWKFCLVLLISEAIVKLLNQPLDEERKQWKSDNVIYSALEIDLYWNFLTSAVELFCFLFVLLMFLWTWKFMRQDPTDQFPSLQECVSGVMLSSLGRVLVLPSILWGMNFSILYTWLCYLFTMAANIQAVRVLCPQMNLIAVTLCIILGHCCAFAVSGLLTQMKSAVS